MSVPGPGVEEAVAGREDAAVAGQRLLHEAHQPQHLAAAVGGVLHVEREAVVEVVLVDGEPDEVVGGLEHGGALGAAGVAAVDGAGEAADGAAELLAVRHLVEQLVVGLHLGEHADEAAVAGAHAPLVVAHRDLADVRLRRADGDQEQPGPADELGGVAEQHGVLHDAGHLGGRARGDVAAEALLEDGAADAVGQRLLHVGHRGLQEDVLVVGDVGAEDAERGRARPRPGAASSSASRGPAPTTCCSGAR